MKRPLKALPILRLAQDDPRVCSELDGILGIPMLSNLMGQQIKAVTKRRRRLRQLKRKKDAAKLEKKTA